MDNNLLPKRILLLRLLELSNKFVKKQDGFVPDLIRIAVIYDLINFVEDFVKSGSFQSKAVWNRYVSTSIANSENNKWQQRISVDSDLIFRKNHKHIVPHRAWVIAKINPNFREGAKYIVDLCSVIRTEESPLLCDKSGQFVYNVIKHVMCMYDRLSDLRAKLWEDLIDINPIVFSVYLDNLTSSTFTATLLSCYTEYDLDNYNSITIQELILIIIIIILSLIILFGLLQKYRKRHRRVLISPIHHNEIEAHEIREVEDRTESVYHEIDESAMKTLSPRQSFHHSYLEIRNSLHSTIHTKAKSRTRIASVSSKSQLVRQTSLRRQRCSIEGSSNDINSAERNEYSDGYLLPITRSIAQDSLFSFGGTGLEFAKSVSSVPEERVEIVCLQALASHSADFRCCQNIIKMGGVQLLQQTYTKRHKSIVIRRQIAKTLGNLSVHQCFHEEIVRAGWVTVLSRWISSSDLTLSLHAARTLANLDTDFVSCTYEDGVYLIHPIYREKESINADIVFVHGLLGGPFKTWRQQDRKGPGADKSSDGTESVKKGTYTFCWPKDWLAKDCGNIRILSVEYDTDLSTWNANRKVWRGLTVRASSILQKLKKADIGSRPIIWVGHSMGGLLIKQILSIADDTPGLDNIVNNTVGVLFYSTPHRGSSLAHLSNQASLIVAPTVEVKEMGRDSPMLRRLHKDFQQLVMEHGLPCLSFGELEKTQIRTPKLKMLIVPPESSDPGIGEFHAMKTSHLNICKPWDRDSELYTETLKFIRRYLLQGRIENILKAGMTFKDSDR
ncbi:Hypothetical predicted protein [Mytilus galloprovincialis]|uniref:Protein SERAC1 n=1 Tax=Mytilus galloprovincialis TaxID=29158 RepID=A0A8B6FVG2_MYTGA|nr:Hypothetical predicted protein [Mytilus galloprovincialis]